MFKFPAQELPKIAISVSHAAEKHAAEFTPSGFNYVEAEELRKKLSAKH